MNRRPAVLGHRREVFLLVLALVGGLYEAAGRFHWSPQFFNFDHTIQVRGAQSLLAGDGVSVPVVNPAAFSDHHREPIVAWPPGYSVALAPMIALAGDFYPAVMSLELFALLVLFVSWWWITYQLRATLSYEIRTALVGWWFVIASPAWGIGPNDVFSFAFFLMGTALTLRSATHPTAVSSILAGLCYGLAASGRYAYWPLILAGAVASIWAVRERRWAHSAIQLVCSGALVAAIYVRNRSNTEHGAYLKEYGDQAVAGFFPEHLLAVVPFPASLTGIYGAYAPGGFLGSISTQLELAFQPLLWVVAIMLAVGAVWGLAVALRQGAERAIADSCLPRLAAAHGVLTTLFTVGLLGYLSVRYPPHHYPTPADSWVYLAETRYYVPASMTLFLGLGWFLERIKSRQHRFHYAISGGLVLICILAAGPTMLRAKRFVELHLLHTDRSYRAVEEGFSAAVQSQFREMPRSYVYLDEGRSRRDWVSMMGIAVVDPADVIALNQNTCGGTTVVLVYSVSDSSAHMLAMQRQLRAMGAQQTGRLAELIFLTYDPRAET